MKKNRALTAVSAFITPRRGNLLARIVRSGEQFGIMLRGIIPIIFSVIFIISLFCLSGCRETEPDNDYSESGLVFGPLTCDLKLYGGDSKKAGAEIFVMMRGIEAAVSTTIETPVSKFNSKKTKTAADKFEISATAYEMAVQCKDIYEETGGIFNPAIYPLVERWGVSADTLYSNKIENGYKLPTDAEIEAILPYCRYEYLDITKEGAGGSEKYYFGITDNAAAKMEIDFGGYAKGYAADKALEICKKYKVKYGTINISGNLYAFGVKADGSLWKIDLKNPFVKGGYPFCTFTTTEISPVSSGVYERYYKITADGVWKGSSGTESLFPDSEWKGSATESLFPDDVYVTHIIDNRNGMPMNLRRDPVTAAYSNDPAGVINATVFSDKSALADAYAKYVSVVGMKDGIRFLEEKGLKGIIIATDGTENGKVKGRYAAVGGIALATAVAGKEYSKIYKDYTAETGYEFL